jgi:hypothetical protein
MSYAHLSQHERYQIQYLRGLFFPNFRIRHGAKNQISDLPSKPGLPHVRASDRV